MSTSESEIMKSANVRAMSLDEALAFLKVECVGKARFDRIALAFFSHEDKTNLQAILISEQARL